MDLSVITPTCQRSAHLTNCLWQFQQQSMGGLQVEHIVVSDGPDAHAAALSHRFNAKYLELETSHGDYGAAARDLGIRHATGKYVCFWDDDNVYESHALTTLFAAASGVDLGIVRTQHRLRKNTGFVAIPRQWRGSFVCGDIDTMCVCVLRSIASSVPWEQAGVCVNTDYQWFKRLATQKLRLRFLPICIGIHA